MISYPIIKIPRSIIDALKSSPFLPNTPAIPIHPSGPAEPSKPQNYSFSGCMIVFSLIMGAIVVFAFDIFDGLWFIKIFGILSASFFLFIGIANLSSVTEANENYPHVLSEYSQKKRIYERELSDYNEKMKKYQQECEAHRLKVSQVLDSYQTIAHRKSAVLERLKENKNFLSENSTSTINKVGRTEEEFYYKLINHFGNNIYINLGFAVAKSENLVVPDYIYFDPNSNLLIDIEIDEPYEIESGKPIHYVGIDNWRDSYFLSRDFIVVRFAEEQVVKYPGNCCEVIQYLVETILSGKQVEIERSFTMPSIKQWTEEEAHTMAYQKYRDHYT